MSNDPKILVEFSPEEAKWLADRLVEMRSGWNAAALVKAMGIQERGEASENEKRMILEIEDHKKMEATIRNRILNNADDQGFGHL